MGASLQFPHANCTKGEEGVREHKGRLRSRGELKEASHHLALIRENRDFVLMVIVLFWSFVLTCKLVFLLCCVVFFGGDSIITGFTSPFLF